MNHEHFLVIIGNICCTGSRFARHVPGPIHSGASDAHRQDGVLGIVEKSVYILIDAATGLPLQTAAGSCRTKHWRVADFGVHRREGVYVPGVSVVGRKGLFSATRHGDTQAK